MDVSIIIVNFNTFQITCNCIESIYRTTQSISFEIILIDNHSRDVKPEAFLEKFPLVKLINLPYNAGFGKANNIGMEQASGRYLLLLNSDTVVQPGCLDNCFLWMESEETKAQNIGVAGCGLLNPDNTHQPSSFPYLNNNLWVYFITNNLIAFKVLQLLGADRHKNFDFRKTQRVGDISGAFMFIRREIALRSGFFDTDFFMYCEDTEWCRERLAKLCQIYYYAPAKCVHLGGQSAPQSQMYYQSKLSYSLMWYKKGWAQYLGYLILSYFNSLTNFLGYPFFSIQTRAIAKKYAKAFIVLLPYLISEIPRYPRARNSRKEVLVYTKAREAMQL